MAVREISPDRPTPRIPTRDMQEVSVRLKRETDDSYQILIAPGLFEQAAARLAGLFGGCAFAVVSDSNVAKLYAAALTAKLRELGCRVAAPIVFPAGEQSKTRRVKSRVEDRMFRAGLGRDTVVVALGGGVVGDLAGFVAATYARGVKLVQIPTSLLAMVYSSIGGKTGLDVPWGKNLIGAFHQPAIVLIDPRLLGTLDPIQFRAGMAEVVKHAVIRDRRLFDFLETNLAGITHGEEGLLAELIQRNCRIKAAVVEEDERESNLRQILNFGHTVGHAVETSCGYRLLHGEAVAAGMSVEADIASRMGLLSEGAARRVSDLLQRLELPVDLAGLKTSAEKLIELTALDKKARQGRPKYALPSAIGEMARAGGGSYVHEVDEWLVREALLEKGAQP